MSAYAFYTASKEREREREREGEGKKQIYCGDDYTNV